MISKDLNISHSTVQYIYNKYLRTKIIYDLPKKGRAHKHSSREKADMSYLKEGIIPYCLRYYHRKI